MNCLIATKQSSSMRTARTTGSGVNEKTAEQIFQTTFLKTDPTVAGLQPLTGKRSDNERAGEETIKGR